jgi:ATP-dependent DNA helicase DinG
MAAIIYTHSDLMNKSSGNIHHQCHRIAETTKVFENHQSYICWLEESKNGIRTLNAIPEALCRQLYTDLWQTPYPCVLTSGTLSVNGDFELFKAQTGIDLVNHARIMETHKPSPFDFWNQALLYIPDTMPFPNTRSEKYITAITMQIKSLLHAIHGHTMILFTSYHLMERIYHEIQKEPLPFPLFIMNRRRLDAISEFRKSGNGVLFASDSAGEGIDLAGDILSGVIIVRLPFPVPDPVMEQERFHYTNNEEYLQTAILPTMLIKLRQWIGRGIRRESDTAVFAILDSRAGQNGKYRKAVLDTLPLMPITNSIRTIRQFIHQKKRAGYFEETS